MPQVNKPLLRYGMAWPSRHPTGRCAASNKTAAGSATEATAAAMAIMEAVS
ncbi:hypothetical protein [Pseudonocardia sp. MH-G8]|uniref:hypothetical protein n=1 Tax=Pseudonocardia sp. MH-G8 TaxID=1854588 RepID=UPI00130411BC|nr:hypothetical protein [Pseudonocardia sp. MH-G8]